VSRDDTVIEDLKSRNGTFVGGQRLTTPVSLHDDDQVSFGNLKFYFRMLDPSKTTDTLSLHGFQGIPSSGTTRTAGPRR
jgi:pSer/pThr/pTyr-binding forkhead associated (FHA) protein